MKKLLLFLSVFESSQVFASHLLGGFINTTQIGLSDSVNITVTLFSDPQGIANPTTLTLNDLVKVNGFYQTSTNITLTQQSTGTWQGVNTAVYSTITTLTAGEHRLIYTNCCRGPLTNASSAMNSNFTIALDYTKTASGTTPNSAPYIVNYLPVKWINGVTSQSMLFTFDADGDSILIEKDDALNQHANNTFVPLAPFSQLFNYGSYSVDPSGLITWNPTTLGQFGTGFKISEYRNGTLIGVNRVQQVFQVEQGSTPSIPWPFVQVNHNLINGDSTMITINGISNSTSSNLFIEGVDVLQTSDSTWSLINLEIGTYRAVSRVTNNSSNMDYPFTFKVVSTIGVEEYVKPGYHKIYDWNGNLIYEGERVPWRLMKGFYIHITNEGVEKIYVD